MATVALPRLAIIGCGAVVDWHLLPALKRQGWLPSVLIDPNQAGIKAVSRRMGAKGKSVLTGSDWRSMLDTFDAAVVAVPHTLHAPIGIGLLEAGKHVFMEKPLATKVADCERMIAAADEKGVVLSVGVLRRYLKGTRWTKALIESGTLGEITSFDLSEGSVFNWDITTDAFLRPALAGGGVLMDIGAHTLDLVTWWLGDIASFEYRDDAEGGVEANCVLTCKMASGATGRIELSRARDLRNTIRINGTKGFVEIHISKNEVYGGSPNALAFSHGGVTGTTMEPQFFPELFDAELRDFKNSVIGPSRVGIGGREGVKSVDIIERCYAARQPLTMPWTDVALPKLNGSSAKRPSLPAGSKALITGAAGFIGGRLAETLLAQGVDVHCVVRKFGSATRLARIGAKLIPANLADAGQMDKAIEGADYVFHCAHDMRSDTQNLEGLDNIIAACRKHKVARLVYVSTFSVYEPFPDGRLSEGTRDGDKAWTYVRSKLEMEGRVFKAVREENVAATIVQPAIVYGPYSKAWTNAPAENLIYGKVVLPKEIGLCNAVYVDDLVDGFILAALRPEAVGERFVMSGPAPVGWGTFFESFAAALGTDMPVYEDAAAIAKQNSGVVRDLKLVAKNPKRIMQIIVRWYPARQALQAGLDSLPEPLKKLVDKHYFGAGGRKPGETVLPDPQQLKLYMAKAHVDNGKAERLLGYHPRYDFASGMELTARYLKWAYSDLVRMVALKKQAEPVVSAGAPLDTADAR